MGSEQEEKVRVSLGKWWHTWQRKGVMKDSSILSKWENGGSINRKGQKSKNFWEVSGACWISY